MGDTWKDIEKYYENIMKQVVERCEDLLKEAIQEAIYDISDPIMTWWERTNAFKNSVSSMMNSDGSFIIYIDSSKFNYYSYVNGQKTDRNVSEAIGWWLEGGHHGGVGSGMYRNYDARKFLELAQSKIKSEFPDLNVEIINEQPEWV